MSVPAWSLSSMSAPKLPETRRIAGIATTAELVAEGFSDRRIKTLVGRGDLYQTPRGGWGSSSAGQCGESGHDPLLGHRHRSAEYLGEKADPQFLDLPSDRRDIRTGTGT